MKRSTRTMRLAAVAAASALVLAACGGDSDDDNDDAPAATGDGELVIGSLLPQTGSLAYLGPPEFAGVDLAINDINEAGGVLGKDVKHVKADSGDTTSGIAPSETDKLLKANADVIVGAASSGVTATVIDKILSSGTVMFSPANTSTDFDEGKYGEPDLYFRTAPSDVLQGAVLANLLIKDGRQNVAILARQDSYGDTLVKEVKKGLEAAGATVAAEEFYPEDKVPSDTQIASIASAQPDALVLITFAEIGDIMPLLTQASVAPTDVPTYMVDGNTASYSEDDDADPAFPNGTLVGAKGTIPGAEATSDFKDRLATVDDSLKDYAYAAESYDATIVSALAAIAADSDAGEEIAKHIVDVTTGGTKCTTFADCKKLLEDGEDIDYDGVSGPIELGETGSPTAASIGIYEYDDNNKPQPVDYISGRI